jgi:uncharacterized membrane protein
MVTLIVIVVVLVVVAGSVWAAKRVKHPENTSATGTDTAGSSTSERFYTDPGRPAGPDAEDPVGGAGSAPG